MLKLSESNLLFTDSCIKLWDRINNLWFHIFNLDYAFKFKGTRNLGFEPIWFQHILEIVFPSIDVPLPDCSFLSYFAPLHISPYLSNVVLDDCYIVTCVTDQLRNEPVSCCRWRGWRNRAWLVHITHHWSFTHFIEIMRPRWTKPRLFNFLNIYWFGWSEWAHWLRHDWDWALRELSVHI